MGRHEAKLSVGRRATGWAMGAGIVAILGFSVWSLADDPTPSPPPGMFGAAARPGTFALPETSLATTTTVAVTSTVTVATSRPTTEPPGPSTTAGTTTTTLAPLLIAADGLGAIDLGQPYEETVQAVSDRLGPATEDTGWIGATSDLGICPGTVVRMVRWSSLRLLFSDGPTEFGDEFRHFFYYSQSTVGTDEVLDLTTPEGIGLDSTVADLEAAYGDDLTVESTHRFGVGFFVAPPQGGLLSGTLTTSSPDGSVTSIGGGFGCGG